MVNLRLSPSGVEYNGPVSEFFVAMREAKKFLSGHRKWGLIRSELQTMRLRTEELEARINFLADVQTKYEKRIAELEKLIRDLLDARKNGYLEMSSPEIGGEDGIPLHPWHEEWLHHADKMISK